MAQGRIISRSTIFTVGSSLHSWASFEDLLRKVEPDVLVDVRSHPRSRLHHFNQGTLAPRLEQVGLRYVYLGHQLGGRPESGNFDYEAIAMAPSFRAGIDQVMKLAVQFRPILMCSEYEPLECHRYLLVGRALADRGLSVSHVLRDGSIEKQQDTDTRLLALTKQDEPDLLSTREARLAEAYRLQNRRLCRVSGRARS